MLYKSTKNINQKMNYLKAVATWPLVKAFETFYYYKGYEKMPSCPDNFFDLEATLIDGTN